MTRRQAQYPKRRLAARLVALAAMLAFYLFMTGEPADSLYIIYQNTRAQNKLQGANDIFKRLQFKTDEGLTRYPLVQIRRDVECEVINDVTDVGLSVVGQFFRNTFGKHLRVGIHDEQTQCCEE